MTDFGISGFSQAKASALGSKRQMEMALMSLAEQQREWNQAQQEMQPWLTAGTGAINQLAMLTQPGGQLYQTTPTLDQLQMDPSYRWRMQEGINALAASGAAAGNYGSGNLGVALQNYGQNLASTEYSNAWNRWQQEQAQLFNRLSGVAGTGQATAATLGGLGQGYAGMATNTLQNAGQAYQQGLIGQAQGFGSMAQGAGQGFGNVMNYLNYMNQLGGGGGNYGTPSSYMSYDPYSGATFGAGGNAMGWGSMGGDISGIGGADWGAVSGFFG